MSDPTSPLVDQTGRPLGPRAVETRLRLLETTKDLLSQRSVREIRVVEIARKAGTSPATFYQYFKDVEDAVLALAKQSSQELLDVVDTVSGSWDGANALDTARNIVDAFIRHWDEHHAVLRVRNLASDEGDPQFRKVRRESLSPVLQAIAQQIERSQASGHIANEIQPQAAAAALTAILERLAAYRTELEPLGITRKDLVETSARILVQVITGDQPK